MPKNNVSSLLYCFYALRSLVFYLGYIISAVIYAPIVVIIGLFLPYRLRAWLISRWCWFVLKWLHLTCGISVILDFRTEIKKLKPCIVLSNHQSSWEALFLQLLFSPSATVLKKELLHIPFFGWGLRMLEPIVIDRKKPRIAGKQFLEQGAKALKDERWVVLFPEGTRVAPGQKVPFNFGGFRLSTKTQVDILPVYHNAGIYWPPRRFVKYPGRINCIVGELIPGAGQTPQELASQFESALKLMESTMKQPLPQDAPHL